uniref:Uncharacterized protein n=1 Tax=Aegilops tauschii subsp. strangulata TaxID=200361 RepID=A0A453SDE0_AEGTS
WGDVTKMSVMEVIGQLKTYELTLKGRERDQEEEQLMFSRSREKDKQKYRKFDKSKVRCSIVKTMDTILGSVLIRGGRQRRSTGLYNYPRLL